MVEQKQKMDQELEKKKTEKQVEKVKDDEDIKKMEDKKHDEKPVKETNDESTNSSAREKGNKSKDVANIKNEDKKKVKTYLSPKKTEAVVNGRDLRISTKHAVAVCNFIKNKNIDDAMADLYEVSKMKKAVPMKGEIPHRKGKGMMSGRYPLNAVKDILMLLKSLKANAINHELELEKMKITCMPNMASRPAKRFGQGKHKRTHVQIKLISIGGNDK